MSLIEAWLGQVSEFVNLFFILSRKNEGTLLDLDSGLKQTAPLLPAPKLSETEHPPEFDQILDLNNHHHDQNNSNQGQSESGGAPPPPATPLIAFEDSITTSPKQEVPTAGNNKYKQRNYVRFF